MVASLLSLAAGGNLASPLGLSEPTVRGHEPRSDKDGIFTDAKGRRYQRDAKGTVRKLP